MPKACCGGLDWFEVNYSNQVTYMPLEQGKYNISHRVDETTGISVWQQ